MRCTGDTKVAWNASPEHQAHALPDPIREAVVRETIRYHEAIIAALRGMFKA